ncbi:MAG: acyltransferase [Deltaproteobacteria bacterium]
MLNKILGGVFDPILLRAARRISFLAEADNARRARVAADIAPTVKIYPTARVRNMRQDPKAVKVGAGTHLECELFVFWDGGQIEIGKLCHIAAGTRIISQSSVLIGDYVGISHLVDIHDTDCHPLDWRERRLDAEEMFRGGYLSPTKTVSKPVIIEDDVWIGFKATVLKGVRIGRGAIVAAGAVVAEDVPAWAVVAGNPARVVKEMKP